MPLLASHIRFARSVNMADVPEGGGPPSSQLLTSGRSNEVFPDISEETRTVGRVEIFQIFSVLRNGDRTPLLGGNVILAEPPADPNISITMLSLRNPFATRADIAKRIESGMSAGPEWNGYLLENHYTTMRSVTVLQRPGVPPPTIGRTYLLVHNEGLAGEYRQRVRIKTTTTETRLFTEIGANGEPVDFLAQSTVCELFDGLLYDFPGSPPSRTFARNTNKTKIRETVYSDSGMFYGASPLVQPTDINDVWLKVASIYTQVVPNSRTEVASVDQYPSARQILTLASTPREVKVGVTPHTQRIRINEENAGVVHVALLKPLPAPGTVYVDFWSLGNRYTLIDNGAGKMTGHGSGAVNYLTGSLNLTLKSVPDIGSSITISHGESVGYTNRAGQAGYRAPEFAWTMPHSGIKPGSVTITWQSGGVNKTATDNGSGGITGNASGEIDYAAGKVYLRPTAMIDAGGEFLTSYQYASTITQNFAAVSTDAGGFASLTLDQAPAPNSITVRWITVRNVSASSGTSEIVSSSGGGSATPPAIVDVGKPPTPGNVLSASKTYAMPGNEIQFSLQTVAPQTAGTYTWEIDASTMSGTGVDESLVLQGGATTGTFSVTPKQISNPDGSPGMIDDPSGACAGSFALTVASDCPDLRFTVWVKNQALSPITASESIAVDAVGDYPARPWSDTPPPPVITTRDPVTPNETISGPSKALPRMEHAGWTSDTGARVFVKVERTMLPAGSPYADPDGMGYDLPDVYSAKVNGDNSVRWTPSDLAAGFKVIPTVGGLSTKFYLWA